MNRQAVATEGSSRTVRRILAATNRSVTATKAVEWAAEMADRYAAQLLILEVQAPDGPTSAAPAQATADLERLATELAGARGRARVVLEEDPSRAIVQVAEEEEVDVIVVGNVDMRGRKEFLLANVPNRVSHNARCTVVIVNTTQADRRRGRLERLLGSHG